MPPLIITTAEIDIIIANLRRRMTEGVGRIIEDCADYASKRGDTRLAEFLAAMVKNQPFYKPSGLRP